MLHQDYVALRDVNPILENQMENEMLVIQGIQQELHMMGEDASDAPNTALASPFAACLRRGPKPYKP